MVHRSHWQVLRRQPSGSNFFRIWDMVPHCLFCAFRYSFNLLVLLLTDKKGYGANHTLLCLPRETLSVKLSFQLWPRRPKNTYTSVIEQFYRDKMRLCLYYIKFPEKIYWFFKKYFYSQQADFFCVLDKRENLMVRGKVL